ncbi:MAG: ion transporter [Kiloniellales bacterium]|nr:ion transporter [Kiloniellales bacterium]
MRTPVDDRDDLEPDLRRVPPMQTGVMGRAQAVLESALFQRAITVVIMVNAITLGLETSATAMAQAGSFLKSLDRLCLVIFVIELAAKLAVYRTRFHHDPWNIFDFIVVGIALVPAAGGLSVLRSLRILRVLRLVSAVPSMRRVVSALLQVIPGMGSIVALLALVFYVFSVMATKLFGASFTEWFGTIGASAYSLFQVMTLESWSMGIVRPVMEVYPYAWLFFVPFIIVTSFTVLNLFIGIIVDAMQSQHEAERAAERAADVAQAEQERSDRASILAEIRALRGEIAELKQAGGGPDPAR